MRITCSDYILQGGHVLSNIETLKQNGATSIELLMDGTCWDDELGWSRLADALRNADVEFSLHPPSCDTNLTAEMRALRDASFKLYEDTIHFAHDIGARSVVIHPGFCYAHNFDKAQAQRRAKEAIHRLADVARPLGIRLLVENVGFHHASLYTAREYAQLLGDVDPIAGYLIDTGHAHINQWPIAELLAELAPRMYGVHLHDNAQDADSHMAIGAGSIEWGPVLKALRTLPDDCDLILEYAPCATLDQLRAGRALLESALGGR